MVKLPDMHFMFHVVQHSDIPDIKIIMYRLQSLLQTNHEQNRNQTV